MSFIASRLGLVLTLTVIWLIILFLVFYSGARTEGELNATREILQDRTAQVAQLQSRLADVLDAVDQLQVTGEAERQEYYNARFRWDAEQNLERLVASDRIAVLEAQLYDERRTWEMLRATRAKYAELACQVEGSHLDCSTVYAGIRGRR